MKRTFAIILSIGLAASAFAQEKPALMTAYRQASQALEAARTKHPHVQVQGQIKRRDESGVYVYGVVTQCRINVDLGCPSPVNGDVNLLILEPRINIIQKFGGAMYVDNVYFMRMSSGTNAYGAKVPVYVYMTGRPAELVQAELEVNAIYAKAVKLGLDPDTGEPVAVASARQAKEAADRSEDEAKAKAAQAQAQAEKEKKVSDEHLRLRTGAAKAVVVAETNVCGRSNNKIVNVLYLTRVEVMHVDKDAVDHFHVNTNSPSAIFGKVLVHPEDQPTFGSLGDVNNLCPSPGVNGVRATFTLFECEPHTWCLASADAK